jgi:hypothetical protein
MTKTQTTLPHRFPSTEAEHQGQPVEPTDPMTTITAHTALTNPVLPEEFVPDEFRGGSEERRYAHHWGINE